MTGLQFSPVIPVWAILLLLAAGAASVWYTLSRCAMPWQGRLAVFGLRVVGLVILALLLLLPERIRVEEEKQPPIIAVVRDISASMMDSPAQPTDVRMQTAERLLRSRALATREGKYRLMWFDFGAELEAAQAPGSVDPATNPDLVYNAPRTHIHRALNQLAQRHRGLNIAGVVLLTDGLDQSQEPLTLEARRIPVIVPELEPPLPKATTQADEIWVDDLSHPDMLVVGWKGQVDVTIKRNGTSKVGCTVHLYRNGERERSSMLVFEPGETAKSVDFSIAPIEVGRVSYRLEIEPGADTDPSNNARAFMVDVTDPQNRVLYLEGTLRWEFKFIKRALLKEKNFQLSAFVQSAPGVFMNFSEGTDQGQLGGLPELSTATALKYRAIILGEMQAGALTEDQQKAVHDFVEKGGGLLFIAGKQAYGSEGWPGAPQMETLLPFTNTAESRVQDGRFSVTIEPLGKGHAALSGLDTMGSLPHVQSLWAPVQPRPAASVLLTDSLHTWQLAAPRLDEQKSLYEQFFSQLTYWLAPQEREVNDSVDLQIVTASAQAELRELVTIGAVLGELNGPPEGTAMVATIRTPDGRELTQELSPAQLGTEVGLNSQVWGWRGAFTPHTPGEYTLTVRDSAGGAEAQARLLVVEPQRERSHAPIDRAYLQRLAEQTRGQVVQPQDLDDALDALAYSPLTVRSREQITLWNRAWIIGLLLCLFIAEWYIRSKMDMV